MDKILFVATIFRCGEKVYPILPLLAKEYEVDILLHNEMRREFRWPGPKDPRPSFYNECNRLGLKIIKDHRFASFDNYDLVFIDDNFCKGSLGLPDISRKAKAANLKVIGCPHGNHEFSRMSKFINWDVLDYTFVLGSKEQSRMFGGKFSERMIPGGIPDNDCLVDCKRSNSHILVIPGYLPSQNRSKKNKNGYEPFTEKLFLKSGILELQQKYGLPVIVKEKTRSKKNLKKSLGCLEKYDGVEVIMDHDDINGLISSSKVVVGSPSTLCFKSIQVGIPTVLLKGSGMVGNFYDYKGLLDIDSGLISDELDRQFSNGRDEDFISRTLDGGIDFNSSNIYMNKIREIL